jgi:pimeloyl-ACP methyl ester carboxylesterase
LNRQNQTLQVDNARLCYDDAGHGFPIVFLHGWALDRGMWARQTGHFSAHYRVICLDRRGFGESTGNPSLVQEVTDLEALFDALELQRVVLVGVSQAARVALHAACVGLSARIAALVLEGAPAELVVPVETGEVPISRYRELMATGGVEAFRAEWALHPFTRLRSDDPGSLQLIAQMIARTPGRDLQMAAADIARLHTPLEKVRAASLPVLILNGEHDSAARRAAAVTLSREFQQARHTLISNAGHLPCLDSPDDYNDALDAFLRSLMLEPRQPA